MEITNQGPGNLEYIVRIKGNELDPKVFSNDIFSIRVGYPEKDNWKVFNGIKAVNLMNSEELVISFWFYKDGIIGCDPGREYRVACSDTKVRIRSDY